MISAVVTAEERLALINSIWDEQAPRTFYFIHSHNIEERQGQAIQLASSWGEGEFELTITSLRFPSFGNPILTEQREGVLFRDVFLTEKEAIEAILPLLESNASWANTIVKKYKTRLEEVS